MDPAGGRVYEVVQPEYRWVCGDNVDLLIVNLTRFKNKVEFKKEHLRVVRVGHGNLKVSGERPIGGSSGGRGAADRWSRFEKEFRLPEGCITGNIKAKFDRGVLLVTMPKQAKDQLPVPAVSTAPALPSKPDQPRSGVPANSGTDADMSMGRKPEDGKSANVAGAGGDEQKREAEIAKETVTSAASADNGKKSTSSVKEEAQAEPEADTRKKPYSPATTERTTSHPPPPPPTLEAEKPTYRVEALQLRRWPGRLLVNVVLVIMVLLGLAFYLSNRYKKSPQ